MTPTADDLRIATFAVPLSGNKGSASMFLGVRDAFSDADIPAHFSVFSYYPKRDAEIASTMDNVDVFPGHPKDLAFSLCPSIVAGGISRGLVPGAARPAVDALRHADAVLLVGGTTFSDSMLYKVPWNVLAALPAYMLKRPVVFVSQTMGPFGKTANRAAARWTLSRAVDVHGRGRVSTGYVNGLGIDTEYRPDLSFTMHVPELADVASRREVVAGMLEAIAAGGRQAIGVAPNSIVLKKAADRGIDYIGFLVEAVQTIHDIGYLPILIPHSYRADVDESQTHNNDRSLCHALAARLDDLGIPYFYVDADLDSGELRATISALRILVASRFHSMISALAVGVPPLVFGWGHQKYSEVLHEFGLEELYTSYGDLAETDFSSRLTALDGRRDEVAARISQSLPTVVGDAAQLPDRILSAVRPG